MGIPQAKELFSTGRSTLIAQDVNFDILGRPQSTFFFWLSTVSKMYFNSKLLFESFIVWLEHNRQWTISRSHATKVIIEKSCGEVSLMGQDTIENVS